MRKVKNLWKKKYRAVLEKLGVITTEIEILIIKDAIGEISEAEGKRLDKWIEKRKNNWKIYSDKRESYKKDEEYKKRLDEADLDIKKYYLSNMRR